MSNYLNGDKGAIIIHSAQVPTNIKLLTESSASSFTSSDSVKFFPFQNGGLIYDTDSLATEDSGRSVSGRIDISWIISRIRKLEIILPPCSIAFYSVIADRVLGRIYWITYFDPITNAEKSINVYTSNGRADMYSGVIHNGLLTGCSFSAIEMDGEH